MAGITDRPFRQLCKRLGAGMAVSEMVTANSLLWGSKKTLNRTNHLGEQEPRVVQIAGSDPELLAEAARYNADQGAQIIDINMGCPAKKVCNVMAGSALLRDERLVGRILEAVVGAVTVPVTLKIRTGWDSGSRNGVRIARIAEAAGIQALAVHGRTRACGYKGHAEYDTIRAIKETTRGSSGKSITTWPPAPTLRARVSAKSGTRCWSTSGPSMSSTESTRACEWPASISAGTASPNPTVPLFAKRSISWRPAHNNWPQLGIFSTG